VAERVQDLYQCRFGRGQDPKDFVSRTAFVDRKTDVCVIPPNSFALARTVAIFSSAARCAGDLPWQIYYARCGIIVNVTPLEPGWEGHVTLEFSNTTPLPAKSMPMRGRASSSFSRAMSRAKPAMLIARENIWASAA
jgi:dCTP deaminase